jgi:hypothetical protein
VAEVGGSQESGCFLVFLNEANNEKSKHKKYSQQQLKLLKKLVILNIEV